MIDEDSVSDCEEWRTLSAKLLEGCWEILEDYAEEALALYASEAAAAAEIKDLQEVGESKEDGEERDGGDEREESKDDISSEDGSYNGIRQGGVDEDEDDDEEDGSEGDEFYHDDYQDLEDDEFLAAISLREESKQDEKVLCKICFENKANVIFVPCGHFMR